MATRRSESGSGRRSQTQLYLDAGQRHIGCVECKTCGVMYMPGQPEDERLHARVHEAAVRGVAFHGWKNERRHACTYDGLVRGRVVEVRPGDSKAWLSKAAEVLTVMDLELGGGGVASLREGQKLYLFVDDGHVLGGVLAVDLHEARRRDMRTGDVDAAKVRASLGVDKVWTHASARRRGIASQLVDVARRTFHYGCIVPRAECAFSQPTFKGRMFADRYVNDQSGVARASKNKQKNKKKRKKMTVAQMMFVTPGQQKSSKKQKRAEAAKKKKEEKDNDEKEATRTILIF